MGSGVKEFFKGVLNPNSESSAKRLITLILAFQYVVVSFIVSFFVFYLILFTPKGTVNKDLLDVLKTIFEYDFYIILAGLGFITADNLGQMLVEKAKSKVQESIATGLPSSDTMTVNTMNVDQTKIDNRNKD